MSKFTGSLLGLAIGDALGAPLEGLKSGFIQQLFGEVTDYIDPIHAFPDRPGKWRLKGLYTDDTQQALCVAEALAVYGGADAKALGDLYIRLAEEGPADTRFGAHRGTGHFFRRSVQAMKEEKIDPRRCGQSSAGNGAAMRIAPVGLYYADDDEALARAAIDFSLMTHHDPRGVAAALAVARAVGWLVSATEKIHVDDLAERLHEWLRGWEERLYEDYRELLDPLIGRGVLHHMSRVLSVLPTLLRERDDVLAEKTIVGMANESEPTEKITQSNAGFAPASVGMALYRALAAKDFEDAVRTAINAGGDADTAGAMAGAVAGARFGEEEIPENWLKGLINLPQVRQRARALEAHEVDWADWEDLVAMETELTSRELDAVSRGLSENKKAGGKEGSQASGSAGKGGKKSPLQGLRWICLSLRPPEVWLGNLPPAEEGDPLRAEKRKKSLRGRKRIDWKETRRQKGKMGEKKEDGEAD